MPTARLYHNADCSKCRSALALLLERGVDVEVVSYLEQPPSLDELRMLVRKVDAPPTALLRVTDDEAARGLLEPGVEPDAVLAALVAEPRRLQRPILVIGERAVVARPPERVLELL